MSISFISVFSHLCEYITKIKKASRTISAIKTALIAVADVKIAMTINKIMETSSKIIEPNSSRLFFFEKLNEKQKINEIK